MRYVAFDIECADTYQNTSDMCAFGYSIADEDFNIISTTEITIKPKKVGRFIGRKFGWTMDDFKDAPKFIEVYPEIKALLEQPDQMIFAHSAISDLKFLGRECRKNNVDAPKIKVYDTQPMFRSYTGNEKYALSDTKEWSGADFENHRASDDAKGCLYIPKRIFELEGREKFQTIMERFKNTIVGTDDAEKALDHEDQAVELRRLFSQKQVKSFANVMEGITVSVSKEMWAKHLDIVSEIGTRVLFNSGRMTEDINSADIHVSMGAIMDNKRIQLSNTGREIVRMTDREILGAISNGDIEAQMKRFKDIWKNAVRHNINNRS
jgi:hypothetical protein